MLIDSSGFWRIFLLVRLSQIRITQAAAAQAAEKAALEARAIV